MQHYVISMQIFVSCLQRLLLMQWSITFYKESNNKYGTVNNLQLLEFMALHSADQIFNFMNAKNSSGVAFHFCCRLVKSLIADITYLTISMDRASIKPRETVVHRAKQFPWHELIAVAIPVKLFTQYLPILNKLIMTAEIKHFYGWWTFSRLPSYTVACLWRRLLYLDPGLWRRKWAIRHCNATMLVREWKVSFKDVIQNQYSIRRRQVSVLSNMQRIKNKQEVCKNKLHDIWILGQISKFCTACLSQGELNV